jgi:hypothetical protein
MGWWQRLRGDDVQVVYPDWVLTEYSVSGDIPHLFRFASLPVSFEVEVHRCALCNRQLMDGEKVWVGYDLAGGMPFVQHPEPRLPDFVTRPAVR